MSTIRHRISKLERSIPNEDDTPEFWHVTFMGPSDDGPGEVEAVGYRATLQDGQEVHSKPDECLEEFQQRLLELVSQTNGRRYPITIIDKVTDEI